MDHPSGARRFSETPISLEQILAAIECYCDCWGVGFDHDANADGSRVRFVITARPLPGVTWDGPLCLSCPSVAKEFHVERYDQDAGLDAITDAFSVTLSSSRTEFRIAGEVAICTGFADYVRLLSDNEVPLKVRVNMKFVDLGVHPNRCSSEFPNTPTAVAAAFSAYAARVAFNLHGDSSDQISCRGNLSGATFNSILSYNYRERRGEYAIAGIDTARKGQGSPVVAVDSPRLATRIAELAKRCRFGGLTGAIEAEGATLVLSPNLQSGVLESVAALEAYTRFGRELCNVE